MSVAPAPYTPGKKSRPKVAPFQPSSRIAIIGAGPAGLTMAYTLQQRGYPNVTVFEKEDQVGGMTRTAWDYGKGKKDIRTVPHELGTCYLATYRHRAILDLMDKVHLNRLDLPTMEILDDKDNWGTKKSFNEWAGMYILKNGLVPPTTPPTDIPGIIMKALEKYLRLRKAIFEDPEEAYLFPRNRPSPEHLKELAMPAYDWLRANDLLVLVPILTQSQTSQGYGYLKEVPLYYMLMWNSDELLGYPAFEEVLDRAVEDRAGLKANFPILYAAMKHLEKETAKRQGDVPAKTFVAQSKSDGKVGADYRALMVQDGFQTLWNRLATGININLGVKDLKITRKTSADAAPVIIEFKQADGEPQRQVFDFLMLSIKYDELEPQGMMKLSDAERTIFKNINNYELTTSIVSCAAGGLQRVPQAFVLDMILDSKDINRCYGTRTSIECVRPGLAYEHDRDVRVAYQVTQTNKTTEELKAQLVADLTKFGAKDIKFEPLRTSENPKRWKYMPHFQGSSLKHLWDLWDMQAVDNLTWYLGCLPCFESTADVYSYNVQLCDYFQVGGASMGQGYNDNATMK